MLQQDVRLYQNQNLKKALYKLNLMKINTKEDKTTSEITENK